MALVYRAQDQLLNRAVALKILYPELSADPSFVERFRREAQAAANLSHPNIVPVFDWGEDRGTYFIVMELIEGQSLAEVLRGGITLTASRTAQFAAQVASALGYAHRQGVVHRDVKPGNILITPEALVKVTDFGIAQAVASEDHLAEAGSVMGTATYFSPEQAEGAAVDGRSDIYSLGVVMYEMLVGRPPFIGDTPLAVSSQHVHGVVTPLTNVNPNVPKDLEAIVMRALAKSPAGRYATADELRADLLRFVDGQPVMASRPGGAFYGADATQAVGIVTPGEKTQSVPVFSGPRTDVKSRYGKRRGRRVLIAALVLLLAAGGGVGAYVATQKHSVVVPNVVNQSAAQADTTLRATGLVPVENLVASDAKTGTVLKTTPTAGTSVPANSSVTVDVALGSTVAPVIVPDVTGLSIAVAESTLQTIGLGYTLAYVTTPTTSTTSSTVAGGSTTTSPTTTLAAGTTTPQPNTVLKQAPIGGTSVKKGTTVTLTVLAPTSTYPVPSLQGQTVGQAAAALGQVGLTVSPTNGSTCSNSVSIGAVVKTSPAAGTNVASGATITLITSIGVCQIVVPNVVTALTTDAIGVLQKAGLTAVVTAASPAACTNGTIGTVESQSLAPGSFAPYNSQIVISVCETSGTTTSSSTTTTSTTTTVVG
jgi:serine/threonine-protein kinase